ncbi:MAG: hypothetical protein CMB80_08730 [Flammeovirgaceae bacterium]|nr:hypothetical protein [Flammeovirgaceae bacterium]HCX23447.1 hypothetical protein [Cytophagales bacterium]
MKFPSIVKTARYRRFEMEPRYYDPIKEEIEERTERLKREMTGEYDGQYTGARISFDRKTRKTASTSMMQLVIAAILGAGVIGWLYLGNDIFYALWAVVPFYLYFRLRKPRNN